MVLAGVWPRGMVLWEGTTPPSAWTDQKHYLPATSFAGGNDEMVNFTARA